MCGVFTAGAIFYLGLDRAALVTVAVNLTLICLLLSVVFRGEARAARVKHIHPGDLASWHGRGVLKVPSRGVGGRRPALMQHLCLMNHLKSLGILLTDLI